MITADAMTSSFGLGGHLQNSLVRGHGTTELLASSHAIARCSPVSASLKSCKVMWAVNSQIPKPPISCRDGGGGGGGQPSHIFGRLSAV